ncbi:MAG: hypothetical protein Q6363_004310 [Candidatus Njordarchaeota archaeon]
MGSSKFGLFHGDYILLCGINKNGETMIHETIDSNNRKIFSEVRIYARGFLVERGECVTNDLNVAIVDVDNKIVDIRCYYDSPTFFLLFFRCIMIP